jgi:hypothetical protein
MWTSVWASIWISIWTFLFFHRCYIHHTFHHTFHMVGDHVQRKKFTLLHYTLFLLLSPVTIFRKNSLKTELDFYFNNILNRDSFCETVHGSTSSTPNSMWYFISIKFLHSVPSWKPRALNRTRISPTIITILQIELFIRYYMYLLIVATIHLFHTLYIQLIHDLFHYCLLTS